MKQTLKKTIDISVENRVRHFARYLLLLRKMQDKNSAAFLATLGNLSLQELNVLNIIGENDPCIMRDIAKQVSLSLSSVTVIVDKLVKAKLVKRLRSEEDRRIVHGSLTGEGKRIYQLQIEHIQSVIQQLFEILTAEEQERLLMIFQKLTQVLK